MKKTCKSPIILTSLFIILTLYLVNSNLIIDSILNYTKLFIEKLFPTSFIIHIIASLLINYQILTELSKLTKIPNKLYIIIMSMISGFPSGPKYTGELHKKMIIKENICNHLLLFTHFPNPLFVLGALTHIIPQKNAIQILISIYLSNFIIALITNKKDEAFTHKKNQTFDFPTALKEAVKSSLSLQLLIYGSNIFFYLISIIITHYISLPPIIYVLTNGILDLTSGIFSAVLLPKNIRAVVILIFLSFGSLSIHIQIKSILNDASLKYKPFLYGRIISTILSFIIFLIISNF